MPGGSCENFRESRCLLDGNPPSLNFFSSYFTRELAGKIKLGLTKRIGRTHYMVNQK